MRWSARWSSLHSTPPARWIAGAGKLTKITPALGLRQLFEISGVSSLPGRDILIRHTTPSNEVVLVEEGTDPEALMLRRCDGTCRFAKSRRCCSCSLSRPVNGSCGSLVPATAASWSPHHPKKRSFDFHRRRYAGRWSGRSRPLPPSGGSFESTMFSLTQGARIGEPMQVVLLRSPARIGRNGAHGTALSF